MFYNLQKKKMKMYFIDFLSLLSILIVFFQMKCFWGHKNTTLGKAFDLSTPDAGLIFFTPYGTPRVPGMIAVFRARWKHSMWPKKKKKYFHILKEATLFSVALSDSLCVCKKLRTPGFTCPFQFYLTRLSLSSCSFWKWMEIPIWPFTKNKYTAYYYSQKHTKQRFCPYQ